MGRLTEFIKEIKAQEGIIAEFDEALWGSLADYITVGRGKEMIVTFRDGMKITIKKYDDMVIMISPCFCGVLFLLTKERASRAAVCSIQDRHVIIF